MRYALILLLLLSACTQANVRELPELAPPEPIVVDEPLQELTTPEPIPEERQLTKWQQMVLKATNITNYQYNIAHGITGGASFHVLDHQIKLSYGRPQNIARGRIVDTIYFDTSKEEAVARCESPDKICDFYADETYSLVYSRAYINTPRDWVVKFQRLEPKSITEEAQIIAQRFTTEVIFETAKAHTTLYIDEFTGLPVRVIEKTQTTQTIEYEDHLIGDVTLSDVVR